MHPKLVHPLKSLSCSLVKFEKLRFFSARISTDEKIPTGMRVEDRLDGEDEFRYWKNRVQIII
jgi:hypothetical protein